MKYFLLVSNKVYLLLLFISIATSCAIIKEFHTKRNNIILYAEGSGGDALGAKLIYDKVRADNIFLLNSIKYINHHTHKGANRIYLIGQSACNNFIANFENLKNKYNAIFCYSHIIDNNILSFVKYNPDSNKITFLGAKQQINKIKMLHKNINTRSAHRIIQTIDLHNQDVIKQFSLDAQKVFKILEKTSFLIGGNYKDANFTDIQISLENYVQTILRYSANQKDISLVLHPRFFADLKTNISKIKKVNDLFSSLMSHGIKSTIYIPPIIFNSDRGFIGISQASPSINSIIYGIQNIKLNSSVFATYDQANITSDDFSGKIRFIGLTNDGDHLGIYQDSRSGAHTVSEIILNDISNFQNKR